jgi:hypothetical protein
MSSKLSSKSKFILATKRALKGDITGQDVASITRHQISQSSNWDWSEENLDSFALSIMIAIQIQFN